VPLNFLYLAGCLTLKFRKGVSPPCGSHINPSFNSSFALDTYIRYSLFSTEVTRLIQLLFYSIVQSLYNIIFYPLILIYTHIKMRSTTVAMALLSSVVAADSVTTLFLPGFDQQPLVASIIGGVCLQLLRSVPSILRF
jgi:hypothetical protein